MSVATCPITKRLNGIDLHDKSRGWRLLRSTMVRPHVQVRRSALVLPRFHGERRTGRAPVFGAPTVRLELFLRATSQTRLEDNWHDLLGLLHAPDLTYEHDADGVTTTAVAELESVSEPGDFLAASHMQMTALLVLPGVFLRGETATTGDLAPGTHALTTWGEHTGPISDMIVRFGPGSVDPAVTSPVWGEGIQWLGTVPAGNYLYIDATGWRAWWTSSTTAWEGIYSNGDPIPSRTAGLTRPGQGRLQLWPTSAPFVTPPLLPSETLYPSASLYPAAGGRSDIGRTTPVVITGGTAQIRARGAWL